MNLRELIIATPLLFSSMATHANVFTYEVASNYSFGSGGVFGNSTIIDLSFNNGSTSNLNQSYTFGNLTDVSVRTVGGTFLLNDNFSSPSLTTYSTGFDSTVALLSTNSAGNGTFTLASTPTQTATFQDPTLAGNTLQFAIGASNESIYLSYAPSTGGYYEAQIWNSNAPVSLAATYLPAAVPVPAAVWLFGVGLSFMLFTWRKQIV